jgi:membrane peptidoglycan carboxypeptidase
VVGVVLLLALAWAAYVAVDEFHTSRRQARWLAKSAKELSFKVEPGKSDAVRFPGNGPYDQRLGYSLLPQFTQRLEAQGYRLEAQARMSPRMIAWRDKGLFTPYAEKDQAGLELTDCHGTALYQERYPERTYASYEQVPPALVDSLLFIENRELLDTAHPMRNPAIEWDRFTKAALDQARRMVDDAHRSPGGSTLATQIEKYRHSPEGRTDSGREKLRQMASASVRAYLNGEDTRETRKQIALHYLNTVPLSAKTGFGEVNGLGDGLWVWYGRDFDEVNRLLRPMPVPIAAKPRTTTSGTVSGTKSPDPTLLQAQALAYKQALSLMIAQRRPSYYLGDGEPALVKLTNSYLRVMADSGVITRALRDAALPLPLKLRLVPPAEPPVSFVSRKAATALRTRISSMLELPRAYDLDRIDLKAASTLDGPVQQTATELLRSLKDPEAAHNAGLYGFRLLKEGDDTSKLVFSFTLFERGEHANLLRVQTDNVDQPFDLNEGARLDLGSTSKLRTLVTYLEQIAEMHREWSGLDREALTKLEIHHKDILGQWARDWLLQAEDKSLKAMLNAALEREYSGSPGEMFFTGGGAHHFVNFESEEDHQMFTVRRALWHSVNLVFIRLMRDVVYHITYSRPASIAALLDEDSPQREEYLRRFADQEGSAFTARFYRSYAGKTGPQIDAALLEHHRLTPGRLAATFYGLEPQGSLDDLRAFIALHLGREPDERELQTLQTKYGPDRWSLSDRGYIAGLHPLALWTAGYLRQHPKASLGEVLSHSKEQRQEVYAWLFKTRHKSAQDVRIRELIEQDAFAEVLKDWKKLGYPFDSLTPSYASALGASGDRPAALAELMGTLVNHGIKKPTVRVTRFDFARGTPYETRFVSQPTGEQRVMPAEVADAALDAMTGVVQEGTAKRLKGVFKAEDGSELPVGGKTGTGDHRFDVFGPGGALVSSRVIDRSGTFVFYIGDRYFGTMMVYAHEPYAKDYKFTSAMPAQLLKVMSPAIQPLLDEGGSCAKPTPAKPVTLAVASSGSTSPAASAPLSRASAGSASAPRPSPPR